MATKKNPSIYDDRSTIGSSDELDEYGVWVKLEPQDLGENPDQDDVSFPDLENFSDFSLDETTSGDLSFEDFNDSTGIDDAGFDDVEAVRMDMQSPLPEQAAPPVTAPSEPAAGPADLSTQLLIKIADELSSIKSELSSLKGELSVIHGERPDRDEAEGAGFFDEEDDDKIALTGDELNNIIHTADFTEETGADAGENFNDDYISLEEPGGAVGLSPGPAVENSGEEILYDGLGRPLKGAPAESSGVIPPEEPVPAGADKTEDFPGEILYDGLGRPLTRASAESEETVLELRDTDVLKTLRKSGVDPMTPPPDDVSYLEDDPLAEEQIDLSDAIIDEPDLSAGIKETPLEEPTPDTLSLIDFDDMNDVDMPKVNDDLFEDVSFDDIASGDKAADSSETAAVESEPVGSDFIDVSFDELLTTGAEDETPLEISGDDLSFEMLNEDAKLPIQENIQDNVITDDSFESISLDDDGEKPAAAEAAELDEDLEQALPDDMKINLDFPPLDLPTQEIDESFNDLELDDKNFDGPGAVDTADAGDLTIEVPEDFSIEIPTQPDSDMEVPSTIKVELKNVLAYLDKLLESLPEEKIEEFAKSEYFDTYKKLFEELGIS
ncbi:MAG: hypothetical protein LBB98_04055 [Treponema sp.]|jgi:hypothetical protein|nr:hypothetical protein [Treponema sp.]